MCKRNFPEKYEASTGCVRETPQMKNKIKKGKKRRKGNEHGMCKRNSKHKKKVSTGGVRETPRIKMKTAWDV